MEVLQVVNLSNFSDSNIHNEEDLKNRNKKGKNIKSGLNKANAAIFAFYKKPGEKEAIEYEIRFYDNHNDADAGTMAKERVGPNAKLKKEYNWDEGLKMLDNVVVQVEECQLVEASRRSR